MSEKEREEAGGVPKIDSPGKVAGLIGSLYIWIELLLHGKDMSYKTLYELRQMIMSAAHYLGGDAAVAALHNAIVNCHDDLDKEESETEE